MIKKVYTLNVIYRSTAAGKTGRARQPHARPRNNPLAGASRGCR